MFNFIKPAKPIERLPEEKIDSSYKRYRVQVFISAFMGYLVYYFVRSNFAQAKADMNKLGIFNLQQLGFIASMMGLAYGISKFIMGNLSDRSNPRYFLAIGLIISGIINLLIPSSTNLIFMSILMFLNGWFQGMGWPPCGRIIAHWFSDKERGRAIALWNTSHNFGGALIAWIVIIGTSIFGSWKGAFYLPGILAIIFGFIYMIIARDTPQSVGLPPIEEYKNDYPESQKDMKDKEAELKASEIMFKYVLKNKLLWSIAIANMLVYVIRYGIESWTPTYLSSVYGFGKSEYALAFALFEIGAIPGTIIIGFLSDKVFHGRRGPLSMLCMLIVSVPIIIYWHSSNIIVIDICMTLIGALVYGPMCLVTASALDLVPKKAAGTAAGFVGLFGYIGGILAEWGVGSIAQNFSFTSKMFSVSNWDAAFIFIIACGFLSILFFAFTWNHHNLKAK